MSKQIKKEITPLTKVELTEQLNAHLLKDIQIVDDFTERKQAAKDSIDYHLKLAEEANQEYNQLDEAIKALDLQSTSKYRKSISFKKRTRTA